MAEDLSKHGLYFDYLYNLRVLDPDISGEANDLKDKIGEYTEKLQEFRKIIEEFITVAESIVAEVEQEKLQAVGAQNLLKLLSKHRDAEHQDISNQISEKTIELERLKIQLQYLQRIESDQLEIIENFHENQ